MGVDCAMPGRGRLQLVSRRRSTPFSTGIDRRSAVSFSGGVFDAQDGGCTLQVDLISFTPVVVVNVAVVLGRQNDLFVARVDLFCERGKCCFLRR